VQVESVIDRQIDQHAHAALLRAMREGWNGISRSVVMPSPSP